MVVRRLNQHFILISGKVSVKLGILNVAPARQPNKQLFIGESGKCVVASKKYIIFILKFISNDGHLHG